MLETTVTGECGGRQNCGVELQAKTPDASFPKSKLEQLKACTKDSFCQCQLQPKKTRLLSLASINSKRFSLRDFVCSAVLRSSKRSSGARRPSPRVFDNSETSVSREVLNSFPLNNQIMEFAANSTMEDYRLYGIEFSAIFLDRLSFPTAFRTVEKIQYE